MIKNEAWSMIRGGCELWNNVQTFEMNAELLMLTNSMNEVYAYDKIHSPG